MSSSDDETNIISALEAGANGYIVKDTPSETFLQAVNGVIQVGLFLTTGATKILLKHMRQNRNLLEEAREGLSNREKEILMIMAKGEANPEIARLLEITESTLRTHYQRIQRKLGLQNHNQMVIFAAKYFSSETEPEQPD
jgi:DNA-binding NarL/FixJ family response regulator